MRRNRGGAVSRLVVVILLAAPVLAEAPPRCTPVPIEPPPPSCPTAAITVAEGLEVAPQTTLHLSAADSEAVGAREVAEWSWTVEQPAGSTTEFSPSADVADPTFRTDAAGTYTFTLDVWDSEGERGCEPATVDVVVVPGEALHVELLWSTPGDADPTDSGPVAGADLDLHLVHPDAPQDPAAPDLDGDGAPDPWFDRVYDVFWFNVAPDWGEPGADAADPTLDLDDTDGRGPENINIEEMEDGAVYRIAVHDWNDHGYGESLATVRVWVDGALVWESDAVSLVMQDLWCVASIDADTGTVEPCLDADGNLWITPNYQHPLFFSR